jgi:hypothetical protein
MRCASGAKSYSDVIIRLAEIEAAKPGRKRGKAQPSDADAARPASVDTSA